MSSRRPDDGDQDRAGQNDPGHPETLGEWSEAGLLGEVFARLSRGGPEVLIGPGDDTALLQTSGPVLATTDTMVRGRDWLDAWSSAGDVGHKAVIQNLADLAAMGGVGTGLLVTLVAPPELPAQWCLDLTDGLAAAAAAAGVPVIGGDLSSSLGEVVLSITALGRLVTGRAVTRAGAGPGHVLAVSGALGCADAGWLILQRAGTEKHQVRQAAREWTAEQRAWVEAQRRPTPDLAQGGAAARAGASAMIDVSDGLVRDAGRIASDSGVVVDLTWARLLPMVDRFVGVLSAEQARSAVLGGGEEHVMLATFDPTVVPAGWTVLGDVRGCTDGATPGVLIDGTPVAVLGWDHFSG